MKKKSVLLAAAVAGLVAGASVQSQFAFADHHEGEKKDAKKGGGCGGPGGCGGEAKDTKDAKAANKGGKKGKPKVGTPPAENANKPAETPAH